MKRAWEILSLKVLCQFAKYRIFTALFSKRKLILWRRAKHYTPNSAGLVSRCFILQNNKVNITFCLLYFGPIMDCKESTTTSKLKTLDLIKWELSMESCSGNTPQEVKIYFTKNYLNFWDLCSPQIENRDQNFSIQNLVNTYLIEGECMVSQNLVKFLVAVRDKFSISFPIRLRALISNAVDPLPQSFQDIKIALHQEQNELHKWR